MTDSRSAVPRISRDKQGHVKSTPRLVTVSLVMTTLPRANVSCGRRADALGAMTLASHLIEIPYPKVLYNLLPITGG